MAKLKYHSNITISGIKKLLIPGFIAVLINETPLTKIQPVVTDNAPYLLNVIKALYKAYDFAKVHYVNENETYIWFGINGDEYSTSSITIYNDIDTFSITIYNDIDTYIQKIQQQIAQFPHEQQMIESETNKELDYAVEKQILSNQSYDKIFKAVSIGMDTDITTNEIKDLFGI